MSLVIFQKDITNTAYVNEKQIIRLTERANEKESIFNSANKVCNSNGIYVDVVTLTPEQFQEIVDYVRQAGIAIK